MWKAISQKASFPVSQNPCVEVLVNNTFSPYKNPVNLSHSGSSGKNISADNMISHHINPCKTDFSSEIALLYILGRFQELTRKSQVFCRGTKGKEMYY